MARGPQDDPLGAKPMLPPPTATGAKRAAKLFRQLIDMQRDEPAEPRRAATEPPAPAVPDDPPPTPEGFGGGRRYDGALEVIAASIREPAAPEQSPPPVVLEEEPTPEPVPGPEASLPREEPSLPEATAAAGEMAPIHPPLGAATVRPSAPVPVAATGAGEGTREKLEDAATGAMVIEEPDGGLSFDIEFKDEVFQDLACRITTKDGEVVAVFRVQDANTRRLLESEAGRLRAQLESKGMKVKEVRVEVVG